MTPTYGETRIKYKFCWLPEVICNKIYWLKEFVVKETYTKNGLVDVSNYTDEIDGYVDGWIITEICS